jgi:hypothetical protein
MSGGKAYGEQAAQYTGKQPGEGSVVTSRDTTAPENDMHSSGHTHRKSMRLKEMSTAKIQQTHPALLAADVFAAALEAIPGDDGAGLGRLAGQSC